jgi:hypothetical protein
LKEGGQLVSEGLPGALNRFVEYACVQEQPTRLERDYTKAARTIIADSASHTTSRSATLRFTQFVGWADRMHYLQTNSGGTVIYLDSHSVRDCQFRGGLIGLSTIAQNNVTAGWTNNLFERVNFYANATNVLYFYNNLHWKGSATFDNATANRLVVKDSSFDNVTTAVNSTSLVNNYNAYINTANRLSPNGANDKILGSFTYAGGPLGDYYQSSTDLLNAGSVNADARGLYHHTVLTSLAKETNSVVDIGFHLVATDSSGIPLDADGDGIADYLEDTDGDGSADTGETDWQDANDLGLKVWITQPKTNSIIP